LPPSLWIPGSRTKRRREYSPTTRKTSRCSSRNNHINCELGRNYTAPAELLVEAGGNRIERFERRTGLPVSRIMVAPGGSVGKPCSPICRGRGLEAPVFPTESLRAIIRIKAWTTKLGFLPSEAIRGCPVLPRWALSSDMTNTILLAAYLKQAVILRGHHQTQDGSRCSIRQPALSIRSAL